jgi:hypothetical protein
VNIYLSKPFARLAARQGLTDAQICRSVNEMAEGLTGSNLGAGLFKKRIARPGSGKRGSWRVLLGFQEGRKAYFLYLFPKNSRENIAEQELTALKQLTKYYLSMNRDEIRASIDCGELREIICDERPS